MKTLDSILDNSLYERMANSFNQSGSDKESDHSYVNAYIYLFNKYNISIDSDINFLEIGIANRTPEFSSLHAWADIFSNAKIYGLDIDAGKMINDNPRISTYVANQSSIIDLSRFRQDSEYVKFDVILDDGSHVFSDAAFSFEYLLKSLKSGGLYMIEDVSKRSPSWEQTVEEWEIYLSLNNDVEFEIIDTKPGVTDDSIVIGVHKL